MALLATAFSIQAGLKSWNPSRRRWGLLLPIAGQMQLEFGLTQFLVSLYPISA